MNTPDPFKRTCAALYWGAVAEVALLRLDVFSGFIPHAAAASLAGLALIRPGGAYLVGMALYLLGLTYLSPPAAVWFLLFLFLLGSLTGKAASRDWVRMLAVSIPVLCDVQVLGRGFSVEMLPLLLLPLAASRSHAMSAALSGLVLTLSAGIIQKKLVFGHFIATQIAQGLYFTRHSGALDLTDFKWIKTAWTAQSTQTFLRMPLDIARLLIREPELLFMAAGWAAAVYVMSAGREARDKQRRVWLLLAGYVAGVGILSAAYYGTTHLQVLTQETYLFFTIQNLVVSFIVIAGAQCIGGGFRAKPLPSKATKFSPQSQAQPASDQERLKKKELNLEETLKMQAELKDYLQKEFVKQTTALDIDIAGSSAMKEGEDSTKIVTAFAEFWKRVDEKMLQWSGKLLNRAGDGAIFLFEDADRAVQAARDALKSVRELNAKGSGLKLPFKVRIGMHTGELMTDKKTAGGEVFSRVLDISGHLQKAADTDEIRISEDTHKALKTSRGFQPAGTLAKDNIPTFSLKL